MLRNVVNTRGSGAKTLGNDVRTLTSIANALGNDVKTNFQEMSARSGTPPERSQMTERGVAARK